MKNFKMAVGLSVVMALAGASAVFAANAGDLTGLKLEDVAKLVDFQFDEATTTYDVTVFEDVYGVRFTPSIAGGADASINVSISGSGIEDQALTVVKNETFELNLAEQRECSAFAERMMEDDNDYTVILEAANGTYTVNVHRPGSDALADQFELKTWELPNGREMPYYLYVPADYSEDKEYPVVLVPHGGGQFRNPVKDTLIRTAQATTFVKYQKDIIVIAPQGNYVELDFDGTMGWCDRETLELSEFGQGAYDILMNVAEEYSVDKNRLYVAGGSMGGCATVGFIAMHPETFAAGFIACPAFSVESDAAKIFAAAVKEYNVPVWLIHSEIDPTVNFATTKALEEALEEVGAAYHETIFSRSDYIRPTEHFSWVPVFDNEANLDWLLAQSK